MSRFDVGETTLNLFPDGLQTDTLIQNLGPDAVYVDANSAVSDTTGLLLSVGQSVVWQEGRPLFVVSTGVSSIIATQNGGTPNAITEKFNFIGRGVTTQTPGLVWMNAPVSSQFSPIMSSSSFRTLVFVIANPSQAAFTAFPQLIIDWRNEDGTAGLIANDCRLPIFTGGETVTLTVQVRGPRFRFRILNSTTGAAWGQSPLSITVFGLFDAVKDNLGMSGLTIASGTVTSSQTTAYAVWIRAQSLVNWGMYLPCRGTSCFITLHANSGPAANGGVAVTQFGRVSDGIFGSANTVVSNEGEQLLNIGPTVFDNAGIYRVDPNSFLALSAGLVNTGPSCDYTVRVNWEE